MKNTRFKRFKNKFKKQRKSYRISYVLTGVLYCISLLVFLFFMKFFTTRHILDLIISLVGTYLHFKYINIIIHIIFVLLVVHAFWFFFVGVIYIFTKKKVKYVLLQIITILLTIALAFGSYYIFKAYSTIDTAQKKYVTYKSVLISMKDTSKYNKIGMIDSNNDPTGYILPQDMIKKYDIKGEIVKYDNYISMVNDLYDNNIDAMFVQENYPTMFNSYEKFANIANETKVVYSYSKKMENVDNVSYSTKKLTEPFTILLMGVDGTGNGIANNGSFNGDSLMLITFNPNTLTATIFSIPRDTYVPIACNGNKENKINSSAYGGTSCVVNTIQNLTGIDIDYYVKINFSGVVSLVDDLGGIEVDVPVDFCEQDSQRRFDQYTICLNKGVQTLNGEQALALARHRHSLPLGDFQRVQHQQLVVEAMVNKIKTIKSADDFYKILSDVTNNIDTNMSTSQILSFYNVIKDLLTNKLHGSSAISIQKTYLTGYDFSMNISGFGSVYTFQYYKESLSDIVEAMKINLELQEPKLIKTFNFSGNETYEVKVIGKDYYNEKRKEALPNFVGSSLLYLKAWAQERNIIVRSNMIKEGDPLYDNTLSNNTIVSQSIPSGMDVDNISEITVNVIEKNESNTPQDKPQTNVESTSESEPSESTSNNENESTSDLGIDDNISKIIDGSLGN